MPLVTLIVIKYVCRCRHRHCVNLVAQCWPTHVDLALANGGGELAFFIIWLVMIGHFLLLEFTETNA